MTFVTNINIKILGFGGIRTHDILTQFDWLRARRSTWLSYEPIKVECLGCGI